MSNFWEFKNVSNSEAELFLYGEIASRRPWWDESSEKVIQNEFINQLNSQGGRNITVRINSLGGDVFAANVILTNLKLYKQKHNATITSQIDGIAASAATIPMVGADRITALSHAIVMVHDPRIGLMGYYDGADLQTALSAWEVIKESIINAYATRTAINKNELTEMMKTETWMTAEQAKEKGFIDEIMFEEGQGPLVTNNGRYMFVNSVVHDLSKLKNSPPPQLVNASLAAGFNNIKQEPAPKPQPVNKKEEETLEIKTIDELKQNFPELVAQVEAAAKGAGATEERVRIKAIDEIIQTLDPELASKAKYDEPMTAQELAFAALKADAGKGRKYLDDANLDTNESGTKNLAAQPQNQKNEDEKRAEAADEIAKFANKGRK